MTAKTPAQPAPRQTVRELASGALDAARAIVRADDARNLSQRNALAAFLVRVASAGLLYMSQIVLARWMGSAEYGVFVLVWTWVLVLGGLSHLGLGMAMIRLLPAYRATGQLELARGLLLGGRLLALLFSTLAALVGVAVLWWFPTVLSSPYVLPAYLALVCLPMFTLSEVQDGIGRANGWMGAGLIPQYILRPLLLLAGMLAALGLGWPMLAVTAAAVAIAATWLSTIVQSLVIARNLRAEIAPGPRVYTIGRWLMAALPLFVISAAELATQNADILVLSRYLPPAEVGMYFAAAKTMSLVLFVHYAVGSAVANRLSALQASGDLAALERCVRDAVTWTFWPSLLAALVIAAVGKPLLSLFGPSFADAYPVMLILAIGLLARAAVGPAEFILNMLGEQVRCSAALVATALLNIALQFALVPHFGTTGAAAATTTALVAAALLQLLIARRHLALDIGIWSQWRNGRRASGDRQI